MPAPLKAHLPLYIAKRVEDLTHIKSKLEIGDIEAILKINHKVLGSAKSYGLLILEDLFKKLDFKLRNKDMTNTETIIVEIECYLSDLGPICSSFQ